MFPVANFIPNIFKKYLKILRIYFTSSNYELCKFETSRRFKSLKCIKNKLDM